MNSRAKGFLGSLLATLLFVLPALAGYSTLEFGDRGSAVLKLQKALLASGYDPSGTDGKFGRGTENAVKLYQAANGLEADGKAGDQTLTKLYSSQSAAATTTVSTTTATLSSTLKYGDNNDSVKAMQQKLTALGYSTNGVDGAFGAGTQKAVIAFQRSCGLKADGLAGAKTLAAIDSKVASQSSQTTETVSSSATAYTLGDRTLRKGYEGSDVTQLQIYLKNLGYYSGALDGEYGTGTIAAVTAFQKASGLYADGLAGSTTVKALTSSTASSATTSTTTTTTTTTTSGTSGYSILRLGANGTEVTNLQNRLVALGYTLTVNGTYDKETRAAVLQFQQNNGLGADGAAGTLTQTALYGASASGASTESKTQVTVSGDTGKMDGPSTSSVQLLHWFNEVKPSIRSGQYVTVYDPATGLGWKLRLYSLGRHADSEPASATDTAVMFKAFGNQNTWTPKPVYVLLPDGRWTLASMHNVPHLSGSIKDNDFDGHLCVHFLRDMSECEQNDPNYGVQHQNAIRKKWQQMTGQEVAYQ